MNLISTLAMNVARTRHSLTRIGAGGFLLAVGGMDSDGNALSSAELFNPATQSWTTLSGQLNQARCDHAAIMTAGGAIFIIGGLSGVGDYLSSVEIFTPGAAPATTGAFATASTGLSSARAGMRAELLPDGRILVTGGEAGAGAISLGEVYAPGI